MKRFIIKKHDDTDIEKTFMTLLSKEKGFEVTKINDDQGYIKIYFEKGTETIYQEMKRLSILGCLSDISMELIALDDEEVYLFRNLFIQVITTNPSNTEISDILVVGEMTQHEELTSLVKRMVECGELK